jgi:hypothetical protein
MGNRFAVDGLESEVCCDGRLQPQAGSKRSDAELMQ